MLSRCLGRLGVFLGVSREANHESKFHLRANNWIFTQAHAYWDRPAGFETLDADTAERVRAVLQAYVRSFQAVRYLGLRRFLACGGKPEAMGVAWGWKDPRNTFTLPFWKAVYGDLKILQISRNPVDVSASLRKRAERWPALRPSGPGERLKERLMKGDVEYTRSARVRDLRGGFALWKEYEAQCLRMGDAYRNDFLGIRYENFLAEPLAGLGEISRFLCIDVPEERLAAIAAPIDASRAYAFRDRPELAAFYREIASDELVKVLEYDRIALG